MVQLMIGLREHVGPPEHGHPAQADAYPVAVAGKMLVQQGLEFHAFQLGEQ
jgi:hypothetical protein